MFRFELLVVGAALLWASRDPWAHRVLAGTVIALEAVRGILDDLVWIVSHAVAIATGLLALRAGKRDARHHLELAGTGLLAHVGRL